MNSKGQITVLGVGNILFSDEGVGVRAIEALDASYTFADNIHLVDGGVLGLNLLATLAEADYLIVVDAVRNGGAPGTLYRFEGEQIPRRILAKNSLHQVDLLESLTLCQALDRVPETVIVGVEPEDIETLSLELTPAVKEKIEDLIHMVFTELDRLGAGYHPRRSPPDHQGAMENAPGAPHAGCDQTE
ncbi:MAG: HyaD/HybD family hydrogenase maturation endopeptidase [Desulfobacteraceae bacterium]